MAPSRETRRAIPLPPLAPEGVPQKRGYRNNNSGKHDPRHYPRIDKMAILAAYRAWRAGTSDAGIPEDIAQGRVQYTSENGEWNSAVQWKNNASHKDTQKYLKNEKERNRRFTLIKAKKRELAKIFPEETLSESDGEEEPQMMRESSPPLQLASTPVLHPSAPSLHPRSPQSSASPSPGSHTSNLPGSDSSVGPLANPFQVASRAISPREFFTSRLDRWHQLFVIFGALTKEQSDRTDTEYHRSPYNFAAKSGAAFHILVTPEYPYSLAGSPGEFKTFDTQIFRSVPGYPKDAITWQYKSRVFLGNAPYIHFNLCCHDASILGTKVNGELPVYVLESQAAAHSPTTVRSSCTLGARNSAAEYHQDSQEWGGWVASVQGPQSSASYDRLVHLVLCPSGPPLFSVETVIVEHLNQGMSNAVSFPIANVALDLAQWRNVCNATT